jgi:[acyl-carrier-protein] S-malonyltransferase
MTIALLFGGQGTETPNMGLALAREHPDADALLRLASELTGIDAHHALANGGPALARTAVIQPLLTAVGLGAWSALAATGITPSHVAGHSLGEVAAWSVAGAFSAHAAVELAAARGRLMEREALLHPGGMAALSGTEDSVLDHVHAVQSAGSLVVAAHNAPTQWTVSGVAPALAALASRTATMRLPVAGAWHSPAMAGAVDEVRAAAAAAAKAPAVNAPRSVAVVANRTGALATPDDDVAALLAEQLVRPVQWARTLAALAVAGVDHFVVAGPGKLMRALVQKNLGARTRVSIVETLADVDALRAECGR